MCVVIVKYIEIYYFTKNMLITHNSVSPRFGCATPKSIRKAMTSPTLVIKTD